MAVDEYEVRRASWTEEGSAKVVVENIAARVVLGTLVSQTENGLTVQYGSPGMFRLMGCIFTPKWFPLTAAVKVVEDGQMSKVEVVGSDDKGWYLAALSVSAHRGKPSLGERGFIAQFQRVCVELSGIRNFHQPSVRDE